MGMDGTVGVVGTVGMVLVAFILLDCIWLINWYNLFWLIWLGALKAFVVCDCCWSALTAALMTDWNGEGCCWDCCCWLFWNNPQHSALNNSLSMMQQKAMNDLNLLDVFMNFHHEVAGWSLRCQRRRRIHRKASVYWLNSTIRSYSLSFVHVLFIHVQVPDSWIWDPSDSLGINL